MYIPLRLRSVSDRARALPARSAGWGYAQYDAQHARVHSSSSNLEAVVRGCANVFASFVEGSGRTGSDLRKRDGVQDQNVTIGVVVGVLLAAFIIAVVLFLYRYRFTVQFTYKTKKRRSRSGSSKSSKTSASSASSDAGPPPAD